MKQPSTEIQQALFALQDKTYQAFQSKLIPTLSPELIIGVRMPALRKLAKQWKGTEPAFQFMQQLPHTYLEENNLHGLLLCDMTDYPQTILALDAFLPYVDNWATCDLLNPKSFQTHPFQLPTQIQQWLHSEHTYTIRFALGVLLRHYLEDTFSPDYLEWAVCVKHPDYYVHMMVAWYFAEALVKQPEHTLPYFTQHRLSPQIERMGIQKAVDSHRISPEQKLFLCSLSKK